MKKLIFLLLMTISVNMVYSAVVIPDSIQITQDNIELDTVNIVEEPKTKDTDIIPNPILVNSDFTIDYSEFASYITFNIDKRYFYGEEQNDFTDNTIKLAINYSLTRKIHSV